jgi:hypothetical protein
MREPVRKSNRRRSPGGRIELVPEVRFFGSMVQGGSLEGTMVADVVVELSSYRACSRARGGASYTFGVLAILVVAPGIKTQSCQSTRSVPVTAIAVS